METKPKVFIDGREGTTGLQIFERLSMRADIELLLIDEDRRKDVEERKAMLNCADFVFLCLPDPAAREAVSLVENRATRVIDASTAHRTSPRWVYGFAELSREQRQAIRNARFVANPGCHASGVIASVYPLIKLGIMPRDYPLSCFSLTGYSGGGKAMIRAYEQEKTPEMYAPRLYGLDLCHKHLPEIQYVTGLTRPPIFCPIVDDYYSGISTTIMLHNNQLYRTLAAEDIRKAIAEYYMDERYVTVSEELGSGMLESNWGLDGDSMMLTVSGNVELTIITARFDNLGKGAAGAAVQNLDVMLGLQ